VFQPKGENRMAARTTRRSRAALALAAAAAFVLVLGVSGAVAGSSSNDRLHFGTPVFVDRDLAGGEPLVMADALHGRLVYTSHEGTTHLYRDGLTSSPWGNFAFVSNYCNQVNVWTSTDDGVNWARDRYLGSPCPTSPAINTGFSDPDLAMDAGGRIYNTGIDLVNDALFSSADGGLTWDKGTPQCHDGDRPWLAGGDRDQVFLATDTNTGGHEIFTSNDGGNTCSSSGIPDDGSLPDGTSFTGNGKLYTYKGSIVEPIVLNHSDGSFGVGISVLPAGGTAFTPHEAVKGTSMYAHWASIAIDSAGTVYMTWDTDDRQALTVGGCNGGETPAPNKIELVYTKDLGKTWSKPIAVGHPTSARVFWPWVAAGDPGKVSVIWYQTGAGQLADLDCQPAQISIYEAQVLQASTTDPRITTVNAAGRVIHDGQVCQGGTTCVATGQDRRLGDFFTNAVDANGCVLIASGDDTLVDPTTGGPLPTSRPIFIRQDGGPKLVGKGNC
jgi:hypothetical protein